MNQIWSVLFQYSFLQRVPNVLWSNEEWSKSKPFLNTMKVLDKVLLFSFSLSCFFDDPFFIKKQRDTMKRRGKKHHRVIFITSLIKTKNAAFLHQRHHQAGGLYSLFFECTVLFFMAKFPVFRSSFESRSY